MVMAQISRQEMTSYSKAGALAEEVLSSLRTVIAFGGERAEAARFAGELGAAERHGILRSATTGLTMGLMFGFMYCVYGLGFWYGVKLIMDDQETDKFSLCTEDCVIGNRSQLVGDSGKSEADAVLDCINACFRFDPGTLTTALFGILQGGMRRHLTRLGLRQPTSLPSSTGHRPSIVRVMMASDLFTQLEGSSSAMWSSAIPPGLVSLCYPAYSWSSSQGRQQPWWESRAVASPPASS